MLQDVEVLLGALSRFTLQFDEMRRSLSDPKIKYRSDLVLLDVQPRHNRLSWRAYLVVKRLMDLTIASLALIALSPIILAVALAIWIDSGWPVIFMQSRAGRYGKPIRILKFRTMHTSAPKYSLKIGQDDPCVTRLGRFLRRSSIDELPQLINVIKGEMSLVGPRPEQAWIVEQFYQPWQYGRFSAMPGITGWWQVNGRSDKPMHENTELDLFYIENQSLWLDIIILVKTVGVVIGGKGAR